MSKSYKGGYKIVSLHAIDLITMALGVVIEGIYKAIESSYQKALLLSDIVIDGVEKNDVMISELKVVSGSYVIKAYGYEITITSDDEVSAIIPSPKEIIPHEDIQLNGLEVIENSLFQLSLYDNEDDATHLTPLIGKKLCVYDASGVLKYECILSYDSGPTLLTPIIQASNFNLTGCTFKIFEN